MSFLRHLQVLCFIPFRKKRRDKCLTPSFLKNRQALDVGKTICKVLAPFGVKRRDKYLINSFLKDKKTICKVLIICLIINPLWLHKAHAFSVGQEKKVGDKLLGMVRKSFKLLEEPDINQYINELGQEILTVTGPQFFDYHFYVIKDKEFNAFAAPSGLIFIHSGLIESMDEEGELISVMAHECGHVTSRHISDRIKKTSKTSIATAALLIAGIALGGGAISQALITGSMAAGSTMNLKFSREDEEEADRLSFKWMQEMGTNPAPMALMLRKMHKESVYRMANIPPYLLTHPEPKRRLNYVQDLLLNSDNNPSLPSRENFNFLRIKTRILSLTRKPATLRAISLKKLANGTGGPLTMAMAHYGLYLANLNEANFEEAAKELQQVIAAYPDKAILTTDLGVLAYEQRDYQQALKLFLKSQQEDPANNFTLYNLGQTWQQLHENNKAVQIYQNLLRQSPDYAQLHYQVGQIKTLQGETGEGHYHLGLYFWYEGDVKMAKFHLEQAITSPNCSTQLNEKAKNFQAKIKDLEES